MAQRARLVGINHVALEVGDLEAALEFYGAAFELELRGRVPGMAFVDMGDQFVAISEGREQPARSGAQPDRRSGEHRSQSLHDERHFGLVVDDLDVARRALEAAGAEILAGRGLDFRDPWGNHVQVVAYGEIQFSKTGAVLSGMGLGGLTKSEQAREELRRKGLA